MLTAARRCWWPASTRPVAARWQARWRWLRWSWVRGRTPINGLDDSKLLNAARREQLYSRIVERALAWHVVLVEVDEIDRLNIYHATMLGMRLALEGVAHVAQLARIDGNAVPKDLPCRAEALIGGDRLERSIMAASILAKVTRDRLMTELHERHPNTVSTCTKAIPRPRIWRRWPATAPARSTGEASRRCGAALGLDSALESLF